MNGKIAAGILCGGNSRRMGQDKAMLPWGDTTLLGRAVREMESGGRRVFLSVANVRGARAPYQEYEKLCVYDEYPDRGPLEGIRRVFLESGEDAVFFCAVDMPWAGRETIEYLERFWYGEYDCVVLEDQTGVHPLCGIYGRQVVEIIEQQLESGNGRVMDVLKKCRVKKVSLEDSPLSEKTLMNMNTREEYEGEVKRDRISERGR